MKVLWITNLVFPDAAIELGMEKAASGGWLTYFLEILSKNEEIECQVVSGYHQRTYQHFIVNRVHYHMIPVAAVESHALKQQKKKLLQKVVDDFQPDIIHVHGTEFSLGLETFEIKTTAKIAVNMQTVAQGLYDKRNGGLSESVLYRHLAIREALMGKGPLMRRIYSWKRWKREQEYFRKADYIIGNTNYDRAYVNEYSDAVYYMCPYLYRKVFYDHTPWCADDVEEYSIFTGQAAAPLKGLHRLITCLYYLKKDVPNVKLYIPGPDLSSKKMIRNYSYVKYINYLIRKYDLIDNIVFTGVLTEEQMADRMAHSHVVVVPSAMELGSSMVWEAMLIGTPVIASFRGGMTENFVHGESGYYYDYDEVLMLKQYILNVFNSSDLAVQFSNHERARARELHDPQICVDQFIDTYKAILGEDA